MKFHLEIISKKVFIFLLSVCLSAYAFSKDGCFPEKSNRLVNDYVGVLSQNQVIQLENKLVQFNNSTSTQIAIVIVKDLCGYDKATYTIELGEKWEVGQKGKDNGIMIMVKPVGGTGQKQTFIAVGYGLEGAIPDAVNKRIIEQEMIPKFKNNDIYGGLNAATNILMKLASGEFKPGDYKPKPDFSVFASFFLIILFAFIFILSKYQRAKNYSRTNHLGFWAAWMLLNSSTRSHSGHFGGFSSGGGSFGGGFGGGSFGGGGAGGSW